ncbi:MAG: TIGR04013 family B12-binding domain/radical SAM domain-containing protein [Candidatus Micrarchaeia archaeon]
MPKNNKIALIINYTNQNRNSFNSLLGALEANQDINLDVYFASKESEIVTLLKNKQESYDKIIVAFSFFTVNVNKVAKLMSSLLEIKRAINNPSKLIFIAGGPHPSGDPRGTLELGFDFVFIGESEESFPEFLRRVINNGDYFKVKGLFYKEGDEYIFTGRSNKINLDNFPPFSLKYSKFGPIEITRGCPFCCYYCQTPQLFGANVRHRSEDSILEWVKIMRRNKLRDIRYISPDSFAYGSNDGKKVNIDALESLFSKIFELIKPGGRQFIGSFPSEVRPEHVTEETVDIVLKYGSNRKIIFGAQTGSDRLLKEINRGHTAEDVYRAVDVCLKKNLIPHVDFIFGLPGENEEDVTSTIQMIKDLTSKGAIIHAHRFFPLPQTVFSKENRGVVNEKIIKLAGELSRKGLLYGNITEYK